MRKLEPWLEAAKKGITMSRQLKAPVALEEYEMAIAVVENLKEALEKVLEKERPYAGASYVISATALDIDPDSLLRNSNKE